MSTAHPFSLAALPVTPWRNGGGVTREIVSVPRAPGADAADFAWRASIATLDRDGGFSPFPGIDRIITLVSGASQDFNIMTRRGEWQAQVQKLSAAQTLPAGQSGLLYILSGDWQLTDGASDEPALRLGPTQGAWWHLGARARRFMLATPQGLALWAQIVPCVHP